MSEQREALAEALTGTHAVWLGDAYGSHPIEVSPELAQHLAGTLLASDTLARLLADAEQRGADRVAAAVEALHGNDGGWCAECSRANVDDDQHWPCATVRAALTPGAADRVRAEEGGDRG